MGERPTCYVIAGPNGAGKTTFAMRYLLEAVGCRNFVNADMIARGLSPLAPEQMQIQAGRLFLQEIQRNAKVRQDFAFETTLSGRSFVPFIQGLKQEAWQIVLIYLWIPSAEFSEERVRERVLAGGHDIPREVVYRRYPRSVQNFNTLYAPLCDVTLCFDNSGEKPILIFERDNSGITVHDSTRYGKLRTSYDNKRNP
jgi:predicted ABC-type ATPase